MCLGKQLNFFLYYRMSIRKNKIYSKLTQKKYDIYLDKNNSLVRENRDLFYFVNRNVKESPFFITKFFK